MLHYATARVAVVALALWSSAAMADDRDDILASCAQNIGLPPSGCECIADKAMGEFDEDEFAFFMAVVRGDQAAQEAAQSKLSVEQSVRIGERMNQMPGECAG